MGKPTIAEWEKNFFDDANVVHASLHAIIENKDKRLCKKHFLKQLEELLNTIENTIEGIEGIEDISSSKKILFH